ncbi:hypothetical protein PspLS_05198 [Pyricularia sp. CBS 133598]|nr:hypothetical protein PspLS_05198 [Pyricularia sp. CBS 133598]
MATLANSEYMLRAFDFIIPEQNAYGGLYSWSLPADQWQVERCWDWVQGHVFMLQKAKLEAESIGPWQVHEDGGEIPWITLPAGDAIPLVQEDGETPAMADAGESYLVESHGETAARKSTPDSYINYLIPKPD